MEKKRITPRFPYLATALFAMLLAAVVTAAWYYYRFEESRFVAKVKDELSAIANLKMEQIAAWRRERLGDAEVLSRGGLLFIGNGGKETLRNCLRRIGPILTTGKKEYAYQSLIVTDPDGRMIDKMGDTANLPLYLDTGAIRRVVAERKSRFVDFYRCPGCSRTRLDLLAPLLGPDTAAAVAGVVVLRCAPEQFLYPLIKTWPVPSKTSETLLFRQDGNSIVYLNDLKYQKGAALRLRFPIGTSDLPAAQFARGREGFIEGTDYHGAKVFAVGRRIPDSPWYIIAKVDKEEVLAPLRAAARAIMIGAGLIIIAAGSLLVMWWMMRERRIFQKQYLAEAGLKESEEKFRNVFDNSNVGKSITLPDGHVNVNAAFCDMLGYTKEELADRKWQQITHPDDAELTQKNLDEVLSGRIKAARFTKRYIKKNGDVVWTDVGTALQRDEKGNALYFITSVIDITQQKVMEESLARVGNEWQKTFDADLDAIWLLDKDQKIVRSNKMAEKIFNRSRDEMKGKHCWEIVHATTQPIPECPVVRAKTSLRRESMELQMADRWFSVYVDPILDNNGRISGYVHIVGDITERKFTEEKLEESREKLQLTIDQAPVSIATVSMDKRFLSCNRAFCDFLGYSEDEIKQKTIADVTFPEDADIGMADMRAIATGEKKNSVVQKRYVRKDGKVVWGDVCINVVRNSQGKPMYFLAIIQDITERIKNEKELAEAQRLYRELFENVNIGVLRSTPGPQGAFIDVNPAMVKMFEANSREQLMALHPSQIYWDEGQRTIASDAIVAKGFIDDEISYKTLKGKMICCRIHAVKRIDTDGRVFFDATIEDITERKKAENSLKESEEKYRLISDNANDWIYMLGKDGAMLYTSPSCERLTGYAPAEFTGNPHLLLQTTHPDDRDMFEHHIDGISAETAFHSMEFRIVTKVGELRWISHSCSPVYAVDGTYVGRNGTNRDITERKLAENKIILLNNELLQKNAELEQLVYVASHDLRSPLVNVQGFSREMGLLADEIKKITSQAALPEKQRARLDEIMTREFPEDQNYILASVVKMDALLKGLLRLSRLGRVIINYQKTDMDALLSRVVKTMEFQIQQSKATVETGPLPPCIGDPDQLNQVLTNLIDNALKYADPNRPAVVRISGKTKKGVSEYCIEDNGIGIAPEHREKAFEIFHRLDPKKCEGEGLGLAIVKKIVSRLGGNVRLESEPGKGSMFYVTMPGR